MKYGDLLVNFAASFLVAFGVTVLVTLLWNLIASGTATVAWPAALRFGILAGVVFPLLEIWQRKSKGRKSD
ncbi:MAG: hypothetical protein ONB48_19040 [candidate division KSB1 bacterium]|nr:hypothetical protein [candidate division KSB1 bacterium]MDZ7276303.1 hypothetical protein [candidate division KSB1 bacterium]MDZ7287744.1 hypothetical protein [candidate division KSB1 bacterium]MDZ7299916.1 hypothetical protein [candidate division KSB1 bacterium]MDZ7308376.1 hypothetical protein [candidate division KSB1 bacterium]